MVVVTTDLSLACAGNKIGKPHTVPCKVTGKCGSVQVRLIPAPRGTGIVSAPIPKHLLQMAGIEDCYTSARGSTSTLGNFGTEAAARTARGPCSLSHNSGHSCSGTLVRGGMLFGRYLG